MKKILLIIFGCAILLIGIGVTIFFVNSNGTPTKKPEAEQKESKKAVVDGEYSNIEDTLRKQHIYKNYRISNLMVSKQEIFYIVTFQIENIGTEPEDHKHYDFTLLSNTDKVLGIVECEIPELAPGVKETVICQSTNEKIFEAFDYKISSASSKKIEQK